MAKLIIKKIKCFTQEDDTGDDDIRIVVSSAGSARVAWSGSMDTDQVRNLGNIEVDFTGTAMMSLFEADWPDGDDTLGSVSVSEAASAGVDLEARFTGDGANYTVWYRVSTEGTVGGPPVSVGDLLGPGHDHEQCEEEWGSTPVDGGGGVPCPMGSLSVHVKDEKGRPIAGAQVRLLEGGASGVTDAHGIHNFGTLAPGTYTLEAKKEGYAPNPGSTKATVAPTTSQMAQIVLSTVQIEISPKNDQRWYVNMPMDLNKRHGRMVGIAVQSTPPVAGLRVYFTLGPALGNRTGLPAHMQAEVNPGGPSEALTDASGKAIVVLRLSNYGGDAFRVKANLTPNTPANSPGDKYTGWFHVWRKLAYEADCMTRPAGGGAGTYANRLNRAGMQTEMDKVFVELTQTGADNSPAHQRIVTDSEVGAWATALRTGTGQPRYFHLVLMDTIADTPADNPVTFQTAVLDATLTLDASLITLDPRDWFKSATYNEVGGGLSGTLTAANITLTAVDNPYDTYKMRINLTGIAGLNPPVKPVAVRVVFKSWRALSGLQSGPATIISIRGKERRHAASAADMTSAVLNTCLHEPAHAMGMAATKRPDGTAIATTYYKGGHHCNNNSNTCIMWETNSTSTAFCATCTDALKGRNLSSLPQSGDAAY